MKTALIIGATGLVGRSLLELLLQDSHWDKVICFVRRDTGVRHEKLEEHRVNFDEPANWNSLVKGDALFSALGTTLRTAGSKEAQYKVDHTYQNRFAQAASANGVERYVLVSAANASLRSLFFYSRMKAELERDVQRLSFRHLAVLQPGLLAGERAEKRMGERIALKLSRLLGDLPGLGILKAIQARDMAKAMIQIAETQRDAQKVYPMPELFVQAALYDGKHR